MFSCPSGSASNTSSSPFCLLSISTCSVGFLRTMMWNGRYSAHESPFPSPSWLTGVTPCTCAKTVTDCVSALWARRVFSAGPYGRPECRIPVVKRASRDIQENCVSGWLLISDVTHLLGPEGNPASAHVWVTFVRAILWAHSRLSDSLLWREKGKETCGVLCFRVTQQCPNLVCKALWGCQAQILSRGRSIGEKWQKVV